MGRVGHGGQAMGQGHGAGDNAFYSGWDAAGGHAHHARGVPAGRGGRAGEAGSRGTLEASHIPRPLVSPGPPAHLYGAPLSSGCTTAGSMLAQWVAAVRWSLLTQFFRLSGMRPG